MTLRGFFFFSKTLKIETISMKQNAHSMSSKRQGNFSVKKMDFHTMTRGKGFVSMKLTGTFLSIFLSENDS